MNLGTMNKEKIEEGSTCKTQTNMLKRFIAVSPLMIAALAMPESAIAATPLFDANCGACHGNGNAGGARCRHCVK